MDLKIVLENVGPFGSEYSVTLPQRAVLLGDNGAGKTTLMNALRISSNLSQLDVGGKDPAAAYKAAWQNLLAPGETAGKVRVNETSVSISSSKRPTKDGDLQLWFVVDEVEAAIRGGDDRRLVFLAEHFLGDNDLESGTVRELLASWKRVKRELAAESKRVSAYESALGTLATLASPGGDASAVTSLAGAAEWVYHKVEGNPVSVKCPLCANPGVDSANVEQRLAKIRRLQEKMGVGVPAPVISLLTHAIGASRAHHTALKAQAALARETVATAVRKIQHRIKERVNVWVKAAKLDLVFALDIDGAHVSMGLADEEGPIEHASGGQWTVLKLALAAAISSPGRGKGSPVLVAPDRALSPRTVGGIMRMLGRYGGNAYIPTVVGRRGRVAKAWKQVEVSSGD